MRIEYDGEAYDFDMADITVKQAIKIEKHLGCPITEFGDRLQPGEDKPPDMMAIQCLGWLILHDGRGVPIEDTDFSVMRLMQAFSASAATEQEAEDAAVVPTVAGDPAANGHAAAAVPLTVP